MKSLIDSSGTAWDTRIKLSLQYSKFIINGDFFCYPARRQAGGGRQKSPSFLFENLK
jgi:hypothetical protein